MSLSIRHSSEGLRLRTTGRRDRGQTAIASVSSVVWPGAPSAHVALTSGSRCGSLSSGESPGSDILIVCSCGVAEGSVTNRSRGKKYRQTGSAFGPFHCRGYAGGHGRFCFCPPRPTAEKGEGSAAANHSGLWRLSCNIKTPRHAHRLSRTRRLTGPPARACIQLRQGPDSPSLSRCRSSTLWPMGIVLAR